jgi:2-polyprenyl-3-methyl-5-hydroxy-6-metoxy-1,4-benzoquinol methylase
MKTKRTKMSDVPFRGFVMREQFILQRCRGKKVLHLGCIGFQDFPVEERIERFKDHLHCKLMACCDVVGVDYSRDVIESVRSVLGDNEVLCLDVEKELSPLLRERKFDVILAGDIIEHLNSPGAFLGELQACGPDTELLITTPNAFGLNLALRNFFGVVDDSHEHAYLFSPLVLRNLLLRYGFSDLELYGGMQEAVVKHSSLGVLAGGFLFKRIPRLAGTLCMVARQGRTDSGIGR